jgi:carboxymethylenebutenolidase
VCHDSTARPPAGAAPTTRVHARPLVLTSADGNRFAAHLAVPHVRRGAAVLVLPDNHGLSGYYEELTVRLAGHGHPALAIDWFGRTAGTDRRGRDFTGMDRVWPHLRALSGPTVDADMTAGLAELRTRTGGAAAVSLGFCMGGRFAFRTAAAHFGLAGAIGLYGYPGVLRGAPGPTQLAGGFTAPVLGLFGGADEAITPEVVAEFDAALTRAAVPHEFVTYPGAPHGFFELDRPEFSAAQADAWRRILDFLRARES